MKKKTLAVIGLVQVLVLGACGGAGGTTAGQVPPAQEETATEQAAAGEDTKSVTADTENTDTDKPAEEAKDAPEETSAEVPAWKGAYISLLEEERQKIDPEALLGSEDTAEYFDCYWLYDIDKDDVPELILRRGDCEAAYHGEIYTWKDSALKTVSKDLGLGHTTLETDPGENGVVFYNGHMGYAACFRVRMTDSGTEDELLFEDDINERLQAGEDVWYKPASDVIPGAYYLRPYGKNNNLPIIFYETIAQAQAGKSVAGSAGAASYPQNDEQFYDHVMSGKDTLEAVASDEFSKTPGQVPFAELLKEENLYTYGDTQLMLKDRVDVDLNGDGQLECVLYLDPKEGNASETGHNYRIVLSEQDGKVYAYIGWLASEKEITKDGTFLFTDDYGGGSDGMRMLFDGPSSVFYSVPASK